MASLKAFEINGNNFIFHNESIGNRSGFYHETELFINDCFQNSVRIQYYNRTWESYGFQTSMRKCIFSLIETETAWLKEDFKKQNNLKSLRGQAKLDFEKIVNADEKITLLTKAVDTL